MLTNDIVSFEKLGPGDVSRSTKGMAKSADPDQTAPLGTVIWSFGIQA